MSPPLRWLRTLGRGAPAAPAPIAVPIPGADRRSDSPPRWRRLVWLSYGNAFLQGRIKLEDWYRHSLTWEAVGLFRVGTDRRLIAGDGFEWLSGLRLRGAQRLSLELADTVPALDGIGDWDAQVVTCHFAEHRERWRMGEEISEAAAQGEGMDWEARQAAFPLWNRGSYLPPIDAHWRIDVLAGAAPEAPIDWHAERTAIELALRQSGTEGYGHALRAPVPGPFFLGTSGDDTPWARFPVLPDDPALPLPHQLLGELLRRKAAWDNATHPKNEGSLYAQARDDQAARAIEAHGELLSALIGRVQCLAGSETRWKPRPQAAASAG